MTYALGAKSIANMAGVHPDLVALVEHAVALSTQDFGVTEPQVRTLAYQQTLVDRGVSKTLKSNHIECVDRTGRTTNLYGHAVDLVPWNGGAFVWEWPRIYQIAAAMSQAAVAAGLADKLCWGGVWNRWMADYPPTAAGAQAAEQAYIASGHGFVDGPHFEIYVQG